jgi:V8-like Glu-specific endopeptidase
MTKAVQLNLVRNFSPVALRLFVYSIATVAFSACGQHLASSGLLTLKSGTHEKIIGDRDLVAVDSDGSNVPAALRGLLDGIGQLSTGCTAAHIGNGLVLTAGHCISVSPRRSSNSCHLLGVVWGNRGVHPNLKVSKCKTVLHRTYTGTGDYALLEVSDPPPVALNLDFEVSEKPRRLTMLSFPRMRPMEWSGFCALREVPEKSIRDKKFFHTCDSDSGSSGAPLIDIESAKVIGIHAGSSDDFNYAFFVHSMGNLNRIAADQVTHP